MRLLFASGLLEVFVIALPVVDIAHEDHRIRDGDLAVAVHIGSVGIHVDILPAVDEAL